MGLLATTGLAADVPRRFDDYPTIQESLRSLPPNIRSYRLERAGYDLWPAAHASTESSGLTLVGKWGAGPSYRVTGRDSFVYLSRGSEVVIINFADTANSRVLNYLQAPGLVAKSILVGNRLYVSSGYIETFDVSDPADPVKLGSVLARAPAIDVVDTLVYTLYRDTFKVFNFANPESPFLLGACSESGYDLSVANGYAYVGGSGLYVLDVTDPSDPHRIGSWGGDVLSVKARGNICCATTENPSNPGDLTFTILDVRNPSSPLPLSSIDSCGAYDILLFDTLAFLPGYYTGGHVFRILDISDSTHPTTIGSCPTRHEPLGVWANVSASRAYVANFLEGLSVVDIADLTSPQFDTSMLAAGLSEDIAIQGSTAYVATDGCGMKILDITDPVHPWEVGSVDSTRDNMTQTLAVEDSFAFIGWGWRPWLRSVNVLDPANPEKAGGVELFSFPTDLAVRDSILYVAEDGRLQIVNVARPREPVLVGSCNISGTGVDLMLQDTLAYVSSLPTQIVNLVSPTSPSVIGTIPTYGYGLAVRDSIAFAPALYDSMVIYNVRNPSAPVRIGRYTFSGGHVWNAGVALVGTLLYVGGDLLHVLDVSDPLSPTEVTAWRPPYDARRLVYDSRYLYAACYEAGVCILETMPTGIGERIEKGGVTSQFSVSPSITDGPVVIKTDSRVMSTDVCLYDAAGARVNEKQTGVRRDESGFCLWLDLSSLPDGVYFVNLHGDERSFTTKVVKTKGR
jgi:hypothetical protein